MGQAYDGYNTPRCYTTEVKRCKYCSADVVWLKSKNNNNYCVNAYDNGGDYWYRRNDFHRCQEYEDARKNPY